MRTKYRAAKPQPSTSEKSDYTQFDMYSNTAIAKALGGHAFFPLMNQYKEKAKADSSRNICPGCRQSSIGKETSKAHSCVSRKTLEMAFRYGLCEFYAAASTPPRDRDTVLKNSLDLHGEQSGARSAAILPSSITESLDNLDQGFAYAFAPMDLDKQAELAGDLADTMQRDLHTVLTADLPRRYRKAFVGALCTAYRHLVLRIAAAQAPRKEDKFLRLLLHVAAVGKESPLETFDMAGSFGPLVSKWSDSAGAALNWIDANALNWGSEGKVEFGRQCVGCENAQGDEDLSRRLIDHIVSNRLPADAAIPPDMSYGMLYADLYPSVDESRATVWDLSNAVTCTAIEVFYKEARAKHRTAQPGLQKEFADALFSHLEAIPHLFIAYMEILMLELAHTEPFLDKDERHRVVRLLVTPDVLVPAEYDKKPAESSDSDSEDGFALTLWG